VTTLTLPLPPSANRYWRKYKNVMVVSDEAVAYKQEVATLCRTLDLTPFDGDVCVHIDVYRKQRSGDLDNRLKVTLDSLRGILYHDDKQVVEIHARRFDDKKNPRVEVKILEAER
jgi:crossover junction endodeoxyribonuclease RusA